MWSVDLIVITTPEIRRYNLNNLDQENVKLLHKKKLDEKYIDDIGTFTITQVCYLHIIELIHAATRVPLGYYELGNQVKPYRWKAEAEETIEENRNQYENYLTTKTDNDKMNYKKTEVRIRKRREREKLQSNKYLYWWQRNRRNLEINQKVTGRQ